MREKIHKKYWDLGKARLTDRQTQTHRHKHTHTREETAREEAQSLPSAGLNYLAQTQKSTNTSHASARTKIC